MRSLAVVAALVAIGVSGFSRTSDAAMASAQGGGKPATGNPTPGTAQPDPPNPANRVTFVGCLQTVARRAEASASAKATADKSASADGSAVSADSNVPSNARFELTKVERNEIKTYRLEGIDSQFSPFVGARVEITGEIKGPANATPPTLLVEFVQRVAAKCS